MCKTCNHKVLKIKKYSNIIETGNLHSERDEEKQMLKLTACSVKSQKSCCRKKRRLKKVKSIELRAGTLYNNCDCYRRDGLQHDCPRSLCGKEACKVKPWPQCELGTYFLNKWENYNAKIDERPPRTFYGTKAEWLTEVAKRRLKAQTITKT
ncbi:hypothetical protein ACFW04_000205 [Cataglyphis niger]